MIEESLDPDTELDPVEVDALQPPLRTSHFRCSTHVRFDVVHSTVAYEPSHVVHPDPTLSTPFPEVRMRNVPAG